MEQVFELFMNAIKVDYNYSIDFTFKKNVVALFSSQALFKKHGEFIKACIASQRSESEKAFYFIEKQAFKTQIMQYSRTDIELIRKRRKAVQNIVRKILCVLILI
jgi:hypothetical protein